MSNLKMAIIGIVLVAAILGLFKVVLSWEAYKIVLSVIVAIVYMIARYNWKSKPNM